MITKGEWKIAEDTGVIVCNGWLVAHVALDDTIPIKEGVANRRDNANLIAAAPGLLEVAKIALDLVNTVIYEHPNDFIARTQKTVIEKALAKAEEGMK